MLVGDDFNHWNHTVTQQMRYASVFAGDEANHFTDVQTHRLRIEPRLLKMTLTFWDAEENIQYRLHTAPALTWVNTAHLGTPIYS